MEAGLPQLPLLPAKAGIQAFSLRAFPFGSPTQEKNLDPRFRGEERVKEPDGPQATAGAGASGRGSSRR
jgi:hypothetical protein